MALYTKGKELPGYEFNFLNAAGSLGYLWCETPEQAFKLHVESLEGSSAAFKRTPAGVVIPLIPANPGTYPHFAGCQQWSKRPRT